MKPLVALLVFATGMWAAGCASDTPPAQEVQEHLQRGVSGQGELGPLNRGDDPFVNPREGDTTPGHP